jgi:hypothetical protein
VWLASINAFTAGIILLEVADRELQAESTIAGSGDKSRAVRRASSLLASYAERWRGASVLRDIFDTLLDKS